ncbi:prickle-like protein 4 isoform X1 [Zootoca vivipara]|uniref:prickle-like protein 4 isoform X1 n=2 Tax=Zootoca vivipara TaxID=8524 RepID=UPI00293BB9FB|nr:prickle-like protein 4 isoform X1 [Zootoca vivipara]
MEFRACASVLLMSQPSPTWSQREKAPCGGTLAYLLPASSSDSDSGCALEDYSGPITEIPPAEVSPNFDSHLSDAVPAATQNQLRIKTLLQQLPPQDCDARYCPSIGEEERERLQTFAAQRRQESLGQGVTCLVPPTTHGCFCKKCGKRLIRGEKGVYAPKLGNQSYWHPACFVCHTCHQPLVDLIYFQRDGKIYCGRHHAEFFRPRCASCDQLIFTSECMEAEGMRWHEEHFCCLECDLPLGARRYVMKGGQPCCCACFESLYADVCQACGEIIGVDSEQATLQGQHWHAKSCCFCCSICKKALQGQLVTIHNGLLFCSEACSLEKESALSSTGSDSSDSAFTSVPSPDSTPISRIRYSSPGCSSAAARTNPNACEETADSDAMEMLHTSGDSLCPEFRSQEEPRTIFQNRTDSQQFDKSELLADSPQAERGTSGPSSRLEVVHSTVSLMEKQLLGSTFPLTPQQQAGDDHSRGSVSEVWMRDFLQMPPEGSTGKHEAVVEQDDAWCPTCSSSSDSDSEPDGFFFGKPIPKPGARRIVLPDMEQETLGKGIGWAARARASNKHCSIC